MPRISAGSVVINDFAKKGLVIGPKGFGGWTSGTARRGPKTAKVTGGDYAIQRVSGSRQVPLSGTCLADSEEELLEFGEQLTGLGADGQLVRVEVTQAGKTTWAEAYVDGETSFEQEGGQVCADWDIEFYFPSPLKYGESRTFQSGEPAFNHGNFQAVPTFVVTGSRPSGYVIAGPSGLSRTITKPLVAGQPHTIDMRTGRLSIGGVVVSRSSSGDTWGIPAKGKATSTLVGAGTLTQTVEDTYY